MSNKITGSDFGRLINEAMSETNSRKKGQPSSPSPEDESLSLSPFQDYQITVGTDGGTKDDFTSDSKFHITTPTGKASRNADGYSRLLGYIGLNDNSTNRNALKILSKYDNNPKDISANDIDQGLALADNNTIKKVTNYILSKLTSQLISSSQLSRDAESYITNIKQGVDKTKDRVFARVDDPFIANIPFWLKRSKDEKGLDSSDLKTIAKMKDPKNEVGPEDFIEILKDKNNKYNYWVNDLIDYGLVFIDQNKIFDKNSEAQSILKNTLLNLKNISDENRLDPEDTALGKDSPIPQIPVQSRYEARYGGSTPETLRRIFENAISNADNNSIKGRLNAISSFSNKMTDENYYKDLEIDTIMSKTIALDYLRRVVQDYESSAAGFLFENFLAFIVSGTKEGGNVKIEDFSFERQGGSGDVTTNLASAKLLKAGSEVFGGSAKLFAQAAKRRSLSATGQTKIQYILAIKGEDLEKVTVSQQYITLEKFDEFTPAPDVTFPSGYNYFCHVFSSSAKNTKGDEIDIILEKPATSATKAKYISLKTQKNEIKFPIQSSTPIASLDLRAAAYDKKQFNKVASKIMNSTEEKLGEMFKALNNFKIESTKYFSTLSEDDNENKTKAFDSSMEELVNLRNAAFTSFTASSEKEGGILHNPYQGISYTPSFKRLKKKEKATKGALTESKITPIDIKKIIEESFKR